MSTADTRLLVLIDGRARMTTYLMVFLRCLKVIEAGLVDLEVTVIWHDFWNRYASTPKLYEPAFEFGDLVTRSGITAVFKLKLEDAKWPRIARRRREAAKEHLRWFTTNDIMQ